MVTTNGLARQAQWESFRDTAFFTRHLGTMRLMMNSNGWLGASAFPTDSIHKYYHPRYSGRYTYTPQAGLEYPFGLDHEHLSAGGLWVGATINTPRGRKHAVSTSIAGQSIVPDAFPGYYNAEMLGHQSAYDSIYHQSILDIQPGSRRFYDDDGDGLIDEDPPDGFDNDSDWVYASDDWNHNGRPDHGEPHVDEDGGAISENDIYVVYRDSFRTPVIEGHTPLGITVWQKSYSWKQAVQEPIIPIEYTIANTGYNFLDSVYVGFFAEIFLGPYFPINTLSGLPRERQYFLGYMPSVQTAFAWVNLRVTTATPRPPRVTPLGVTLLGASRPVGDLAITYRTSMNMPFSDEGKYNLLSSGFIQRDTIIGNTSTHPIQILSLGPFRNFAHGDTIRFAIALVSGVALNAGYNNLMDNASKALELYNRGFRPPNLPTSPPLKLTTTKNGVILNWKWQPGDPRPNPEETWDENNKFIEALPDTHWRRRNPPEGRTRGGRIFEGYRVWRSDNPIYQENTFSVIHQFDVADDLNFNGQTGIEYTYADTPIVRGRKYWYAVTSFTIPDYYVTLDSITGGDVFLDTTLTQPFESALFDNLQPFQLPFTPSYTIGEVKVVPNPYRTDADYTFENGGWEGLGRMWSEFDRLVWFIHLPPKCTIRIFTIMGEIVKVIEHDDAVRSSTGRPVGQEEFPLLSESNRAIASGVYVYLVESNFGTQTGKFVVIR